MPKLKNLEKAARIYNVPGVDPIHLGPKGQESAVSAPFVVGPLGLGPEVEAALRAQPRRLAVLTE